MLVCLVIANPYIRDENVENGVIIPRENKLFFQEHTKCYPHTVQLQLSEHDGTKGVLFTLKGLYIISYRFRILIHENIFLQQRRS